jgi:hypothetical protein
VIRIETSPDGRVRIIGMLESSALTIALQAAGDGVARLDLSEVFAADGGAVRLLAGLPPDRVTVVACPPWLDVWIARERHAGSAAP